MLEQKISEPVSPQTGALLACGVLAGPLYIALTAIQTLTRDGFDPRQHRYNLLTTGDLGWIHQINYVVTGLLMVLFAVGVRRVQPQGGRGLWGARLLGLYGLAYISSGLFRADPVIGFPPGTLSQSTTWHGTLQLASRGVSGAAFVAALIVIATWFIVQGRWNWVWFSATVPISMGAYELLRVAGVDTSTLYLSFLVPGILIWVWISALGVHLYRRAEQTPRINDDQRLGSRSLVL